MDDKHEYTWPKPWLLELYQRVLEEGCLRIKLHGEAESEENDGEYKSFKAAFLRFRRKRDAVNAMMDSRFQYVSLRYERQLGKVLLIYSALPDDQTLPSIEAVDGKRELPQPLGSQPRLTPEAEPDEFDATAHVRNLIDKVVVEDEEDEGDGTTDLG